MENSPTSTSSTLDIPAQDPLGESAALLSATEVGLGSLLHSFHIPLAGVALSLNQGFILARTSLENPKIYFGPLQISAITALLKTLSPAGKKLTPMLAIAVQGLLFNFGTIIFGTNVLGLGLGITLLALWSFAQPILLFYILFGSRVVNLGEFYLEKIKSQFHLTNENIWLGVAVAIAAKVICSWLVLALSYRLPPHLWQKYLALIFRFKKGRAQPIATPEEKPNIKHSARLALKDMTNPLVIIALVLNFIFIYSIAKDTNEAVCLGLRPLAIAFVLFFSVRMFPIENIFSGNSRFSQSVRKTIGLMRRM